MAPLSTVDNDYAPLLRSARMWAAYALPRDDADADDVAQEAVTRLWRADARGAAWAGEAARYAYVHRAVRTILIDRARSPHGRAVWCALSPALPVEAAEGAALRRIALAETLSTLAALGRNGRAVALHAAGYTPQEIARALGIPGRTAYTALSAGRAALIKRSQA